MLEVDKGGRELGYIGSFSELVGAPEPAIRLLITILAGYPLALLYNQVLVSIASKTLHHIFFALCGFLLCVFNYGFNTFHSLNAICITYFLTRVLYNSPKQLVAISFIFNMTYLLTGYFFTESNEYDILWTMPHCVLTLRMVGFCFDIADGQKPDSELSKDQKETALKEIPNLLEVLAFAYFPCSFLVGPQFPYFRYKRFIDGEFRQYPGNVDEGVKRFGVGVLYLAIRQIGAAYFPDDYFLSDAFVEENFILRLIYLGIWAKLALYKYISCWLLTEGALMLLGFTYAGTDEDGKPDWSGCTNVKLVLLETGNTMGHYVQSFNVNTNTWVGQYVYKRLKFLNNRTISYGAALGFLAVWHGFHSGYYMSFFIEYMIVTVEKQVEQVYETDIMPKYGEVLNNSSLYSALKYFTLKSYNLIYMGWCLTPFIFLSYPRWTKVFQAVYYFGFVYVIFWLICYQIYKTVKRSERKSPLDKLKKGD